MALCALGVRYLGLVVMVAYTPLADSRRSRAPVAFAIGLFAVAAAGGMQSREGVCAAPRALCTSVGARSPPSSTDRKALFCTAEEVSVLLCFLLARGTPERSVPSFLLFLYFAEARKYRRSTKLWRHFAHKGRGGSVAYGSVAYVRTGPWTRPLMSRMNMDRAWCLMLLAPLAPHSIAGDSYGIRRAAF